MTGELTAELEAIADAARGRVLVGIVGAPGSGKSTISERLAASVAGAMVLPMDGFHLDDRILEARGDRARKGAPHTFDVGGFVATLDRVRRGDTVYAPLFDRSLELARAGAIEIGPEVRLVLVEGNYLLHDEGGWEEVRPRLDLCWFIDVPEAELERRLRARWQGFGQSPEEIERKVGGNDMPNARLVMGGRGRADRILTPEETA